MEGSGVKMAFVKRGTLHFGNLFSQCLGLTALGAGRYLTLPFPFSFGVLNATYCHSSAILSDYVNTTIFILLNMYFYSYFLLLSRIRYFDVRLQKGNMILL